MATLFDLNFSGPPPGPTTAGSEEWINLGLIPTGQRLFFGNAQYTSTDKSITFELRTNNDGASAGTLSATALLDATAVSVRAGTVTRDLYRKGRLHIATVYGTGVERCGLRLKSKAGAQGGYLFLGN